MSAIGFDDDSISARFDCRACDTVRKFHVVGEQWGDLVELEKHRAKLDAEWEAAGWVPIDDPDEVPGDVRQGAMEAADAAADEYLRGEGFELDLPGRLEVIDLALSSVRDSWGSPRRRRLASAQQKLGSTSARAVDVPDALRAMALAKAEDALDWYLRDRRYLLGVFERLALIDMAIASAAATWGLGRRAHSGKKA